MQGRRGKCAHIQPMSIPKTMAAMVLTGHGGFDRLEYHRDWPCPTPGPGQVLIRVGACGLNNTDINTRTAWYAPEVKGGITQDAGASGFAPVDDSQATWGGNALTFPRIQGADVAGTIAAVGPGVSPDRVGQRVLCDPWLLAAGDYLDTSASRYLGSEVDGGFADYMVIGTENAYAIDSRFSDAELAAFPCALSTAENLVRRTGLQPGETVAISGASGGVGAMAIQLCKLRGARVIALASPAKADQVLALGADRHIDRNTPRLAEELGVIDVALDVVGQGMFGPLISALRQGGRYSSSGAIAGGQVDFDLRDLIYKDLKMTGATIVPPGTFGRLIKLIEAGQLRPQLAATFDLSALHQAQKTFLEKQHAGNIVVTCI